MDPGGDLRVQLRLYADKPREEQVAKILQDLADENGESVNETAKRILMVFAKAAAQNPAINLTLAQEIAAAQTPTTPATPVPKGNSASEPPKPTSQPKKKKQKPEPKPKSLTESSGMPEIDMSEL